MLNHDHDTDDEHQEGPTSLSWLVQADAGSDGGRSRSGKNGSDSESVESGTGTAMSRIRKRGHGRGHRRGRDGTTRAGSKGRSVRCRLGLMMFFFCQRRYHYKIKAHDCTSFVGHRNCHSIMVIVILPYIHCYISVIFKIKYPEKYLSYLKILLKFLH